MRRIVDECVEAIGLRSEGYGTHSPRRSKASTIYKATNNLRRGPDYRPMDTLVQWGLFDQGGVAPSTDDDITGRVVMFLVVDDVAAERRRLQGPGDRA